MKKLIITLMIIFSAAAFAQVSVTRENNIVMTRGDSVIVTLKVIGDKSTHALNFAVKEGTSFADARLIQKNASDGLSVTYSSPYSSILVTIKPEDTQDLTAKTYYYDVYDSTTKQTIINAYLTIKPDVQTPFDGTDLPENATRITTVSLSNGSLQNEYAKWDTTLKAWVPSGMVPGSGNGSEFDSTYIYQALSGKADVNHNHTGVYEPVKGADDNFVTDAEKIKLSNLSGTNTGDQDLSNYASKTANQTFTGLNTFSGNKTVFGTTTNDSVGVRGRLNVNRKMTIGSGNNLLSFESATLMSGGALPEFNLKIYDPLLSTFANSLMFDYKGLLTIVGRGTYVGLPSGNISYQGGTVNSTDLNWLVARNYAIYSMNGVRTDGDIYIDTGTLTIRDNTNSKDIVFPNIDGSAGQTIKTNGNGNLYWANDATGTGGSSVTDSVHKDGRSVPGDSLTTKEEVLLIGSTPYNFLISDWLDYSASNELKLGKSYNTKRFNNGAYSDVWNIDYVVPPYNLSASWLFPIEHRTDYYNDTLQTVSGVANLLKIDGTGTPIWRASTVTIAGQETQVNVGDLPDSTTLSYSASSTIGNNVILSEENMTASPVRFPMQIKGYNFRIGTNNNYTFPKLYSYYSDLSTGDIEDGYHFYGDGDYPSYFGGNIYTDGVILVGSDTVLTTNDGESIIGTKNTLDSLIVAFWNGTLGSDTTGLYNAVISIINSSSKSTIGTVATLDSIITAFWNGSLGSGSTWDSTYAYQRIAALESTVTSLQNSINNILAALDTCGCSASTADNTPPLKPTSYVAVGGTSETQYVTTWTDPVASDLDSIRWYEGSSNDTTAMTWIASIVAGTETYTRTGRTAGTTYWSAIKAIDDSGNVSYFSNVDSATTQASGGGIPVIESFTTDSVAASATITLTKPSGVQNGDLLLIVVASEDPNDTQQWNNTTNKPTGFTWLSTTIGGGTGTGQNDCQTHIAAFWRIADGSEGATVGVTSVGTGNDQVGYYLRLSGVYGSSPIDVWDSPLDSTYYQQTDTIQIHSQTTNYANELALVVCANDGGDYGLTVSGTGWSAVDDNWIDDTEYGLHLIIGKKDMPTAGATGVATITNATRTPNGSKVGMILTVRSQ